MLAIGNDTQFASLCRAAGGSDIPSDPRFSTNEARVRHRQALLDWLLPVMQANRPARPRVTWTYDAPAERPRPDYRMALVYNAANDLTAQRVCDSQFRHKTGTPGRVSVFAVYCRNDQPMSQTTAWTEASGPDDPRLGAMFSALFQVLFVEVNPNRPMPTFLSPM